MREVNFAWYVNSMQILTLYRSRLYADISSAMAVSLMRIVGYGCYRIAVGVLAYPIYA